VDMDHKEIYVKESSYYSILNSKRIPPYGSSCDPFPPNQPVVGEVQSFVNLANRKMCLTSTKH
jgi:hypothetical protein